MKKEMIGLRFGRLVVVSEAARRGKAIYWRCACDCGAVTEVYGGTLRNGRSQSCGCLNAELAKSRRTTHGKSRSTEHSIWCGMRQRCNDDQHPSYPAYGGRGIQVCARWNASFENFLADMGERPAGMQIDRINNDGNYEPGNCEWATPKEQANNRRSCLNFTLHGRTQTLMQWCEEYGIGYHVAIKRIKQLGWPFEKAITTKPAVKARKSSQPQAAA